MREAGQSVEKTWGRITGLERVGRRKVNELEGVSNTGGCEKDWDVSMDFELWNRPLVILREPGSQNEL